MLSFEYLEMEALICSFSIMEVNSDEPAEFWRMYTLTLCFQLYLLS